MHLESSFKCIRNFFTFSYPSFWVHITLSSLLPRQDDPHLELHCHLDLGRLIGLQPSSLVNKKLFTKSFLPWQPTEQPPLDVPRPRKQNLSNGACHLPAFPTPPYFCYVIIICPHSSPRRSLLLPHNIDQIRYHIPSAQVSKTATVVTVSWPPRVFVQGQD